MPSLSSRMSRSSESTTASGPSLSTPSMDIDTQLVSFPEIRKRSLNLDSDSDDEEPQARRARNDDSNSIQNDESEMAIDTPARNLMAPPRSRQSRTRSSRHTTSRQEQEQISNTFANIGAPTPTVTHSTPVSSPLRANHTVQQGTTRQSHGSTSESRVYEEGSDYDADISGDERPPKRRRGTRQNSVHTPAVPIENRNAGNVAPPALNEASVIQNQGSETASSPVQSVLPAIEAPSNQITSTSRDAAYIDLTLKDSSDEEDNDAGSPPAPSVLPAVVAPPVQDSQPNADRKVVDLTFDDSSDVEGRAATMSKAYIGDRIVLVEEKRLEPFLPEPTIKFQHLLEDAQTQKLHCLEKWHSMGYEDDVEFSRQFAVLGTSGNVYVVGIRKKPFCNCYEGIKEILCVHIVFILTQFLNLPAPLRHQTTFLEAELRCMMGDEIDWMGPVSTDKFCAQKSVAEQETCSICLEDLKDDEKITWCRAQCGKNFHLQCIWNWAQANFEDGQPDITCGNCRAPWIWIDRQLSGLIVSLWNSQFGIRYYEAGYRTWFELLDRDVTREGYFNVADILAMDETVEDDAEARQSYQLLVDRWRAEMVRRPTTLTEEMYQFIVRYHPQVYIDAGYVFANAAENSPRGIRLFETVGFVEMNVRRVLQGLPTIDSEFDRDLHLL